MQSRFNMKRALLALLMSSFLFPVFVFAQPDYTGELDAAGTAVYGSSNSMQGNVYYIVGSIISVLISLIGVIFLILLIYAGFLWMTAGGNEKQVEKAKDMMLRAVVGLVILLASYSLSTF